jgi:DNA-binding NarL/FixJ family response regulator
MGMGLSGRAVRVAVVSRQEVVVRGLTAMLADYPERIVVSALATVWGNAGGVDVVLYDVIGLEHSLGAELDHLLAERGVKVLLYSRNLRPDLRARALEHGPVGWVSMEAEAKELVEAIEMCAAGGPRPEEVERPGHREGLSPREVEVLALITRGYSNKEITERLVLTSNTLKSHIRAIYHKIGVTSRSQAVGWAVQNGFAPPHTEHPSP